MIKVMSLYDDLQEEKEKNLQNAFKEYCKQVRENDNRIVPLGEEDELIYDDEKEKKHR
jgi:hypothetical protein